MNGILAKKLGMTQVFTEQGERVPVTVLEAGPCVVVCHKTEEKDGYTAVQIGFGLKKLMSLFVNTSLNSMSLISKPGRLARNSVQLTSPM